MNAKDALSIRFVGTACSECAWAHDAIQSTGAFDSDSTKSVTPVRHYSDIAERLAPTRQACHHSGSIEKRLRLVTQKALLGNAGRHRNQDTIPFQNPSVAHEFHAPRQENAEKHGSSWNSCTGKTCSRSKRCLQVW